jgi:cytochrome c oxidase assembly protein subunit 11
MSTPRKSAARRNINIVMILVGVFSGMVGLTFASVPLYRIFCAKTGFDGTPLRADGETVKVEPIDRTVTVSFTSDVDANLPWAFYPKQGKIEARVGQTYLAFFEAENKTDKPITGQATFNVSPEPWGPYFVKIQCFCFNQQTLQPHEKVEMPVTFYLDPALAKDHLLDRISDVTLSYTFFRSTEPQQDETKVGAAVPAPEKTVN